jgi:glucans biosynthesis protein C
MTAESARTARFPALDRLRAFSMLFIVFFHIALPYAEGIPWIVVDGTRSPAVRLGIWATMGFPVWIFFTMAGFFSSMLLDRHGTREYLRRRFVPIAVPFVVGVPLFSWFTAWVGDSEFVLHPFHLWFLEHLLVLCCLAPLARLATERLPATSKRSFGTAFQAVTASIWAPLVLSIPTLLLLIYRSFTHADVGIDPTLIAPSTQKLTYTPFVSVYFSLFFGFGWMLYNRHDVLQAISKHWMTFVVGAVLVRLASVPLLAIRGAAMAKAPLSGPLASIAETLGASGVVMVFCVFGALFTWLAVIGFVGLFHRWFSGQDQGGRYLADSSYWVYYFHLVPAVLVGRLMVPSDLPMMAEYLLVSAATVMFCLVTYEYGVRYTIIGLIMNGPRRGSPLGMKLLKRLFSGSPARLDTALPKHSTDAPGD